MAVLEVSALEDCFDDSRTWQVTLSAPLTSEQLVLLGKYGKLSRFEDFPKPFFRLNLADGSLLKGVEDSLELTLVTEEADLEKARSLVESLFNNVLASIL